MKKERQIEIEIVKVEENLFKLNIPEEVNGSVSLGLSCKLEPDEENDLFTILMAVRYEQDSNVLMEYGASFVFKVVNLKELFRRESDKLQAEYDFIPKLVDISFNTLRGMIVVKTGGTILAHRPLPLIDVEKFIVNDLRNGYEK